MNTTYLRDLRRPRPVFVVNILLICLMMSSLTTAQYDFEFFVRVGKADYKYQGDDWAGTCAAGIRQSPMNINTETVVPRSSTKIEFHCKDVYSGIILQEGNELMTAHNGCTATYTSATEESTWTSVQFHFHSPSEHSVDGHFYDAEMHTVFRNDRNKKQLLVLGILFTLDEHAEENEFLTALELEDIYEEGEKFIKNVPMEEFISSTVNDNLFNYQGSLTTPTCDEVVEWFVFKHPVKINEEQLHNFEILWSKNYEFAMGNGNNRRIQDTNRRTVLYLGTQDRSEGGFSFFFVIGFTIIGILLLAVIGDGICFCVRKKKPMQFLFTQAQAQAQTPEPASASSPLIEQKV